MNWIKIEEQLPPKNTLVWVKRQPNKVEQEPMYLAMRNGSELSKNPNAYANCHWYGIPSNALDVEQKTYTGLEFGWSFSDVTVIEWAFVERPEATISSLPHPCVDSLFEIKGCDMPKGSCRACCEDVVPDEWNPASEPPDDERDVRVRLKDGRELKGWFGGFYWHVIYPDSRDQGNGENARPVDTIFVWKEID